MKFLVRIFFFFFVTLTIEGIAQNNSEENIFVPIANPDYRQNSDDTPNSVFYRLNTGNLMNHLRNSNTLELNIPVFEGREKTLMVEKVEVLAPGFRVFDENGTIHSYGAEYKFYQGYIKGNKSQSIAGITIKDDDINILFSDQDGDYQINKFDERTYVGFFTSDLKDTPEFLCNVSNYNEPRDPIISSEERSNGNNECVDIYFEVDYKSYQENGSNITSVTTWAVNLFNQVALQFNRVGVPIKLSDLKIYTSSDPYVSATNTDEALTLFRNNVNAQGFNGRLAHLLSGRNLGGGIAWLGVLCSNYLNCAVSANLGNGVVQYPNYSWNVMVIAHELGHNFGSPHTQACRWNGDNTAIDGCAAPEGNCARPPVPSGGGTIMSYCHLNSTGISLVKGFGEQPGALIFSYYNNAYCTLSTDCSDVPPINDICISAIELTPNISCLNNLIDNSNSRSSGQVPLPSCGDFGNGNDLWFFVTIPSNGKLTIQTNQVTNGLTDLVIQAYTGTCTNLSLYQCDDNSGNENHSNLLIDDISLANQVIYLRVFENGSDAFGEFILCAFSEDIPCDPLTDILLSLYNSWNGNNWTNNQGWQEGSANGDCDICNWYGISCNAQAKVTGIDLSGNNLLGIIPEVIGQLPDLTNLNLSNNNLTGVLPAEIGDLLNLQNINLSNNSFEGTMPPELTNLNKIISINFSNNNFSGQSPSGIGYKNTLQSVDFSNNNLGNCFEPSLNLICTRTLLDLSGNPNLPDNGVTINFCLDYTGTDFDGDNFCYNLDDCDDNRNTVYPGNPEICDGLDNDCNGITDDGFENEQNTWIGSAQGDWMNSEMWSKGEPPKPCEEVLIGWDGIDVEVTYPSQTYMSIKTLKVGNGSSLILNQYGSLSISGKASLENNGTINLYGNLSVEQTENSEVPNLTNNGIIHVHARGGLGIYSGFSEFLVNAETGYIINEGYISIYHSSSGIGGESNLEPPVYGLINYGTFDNYSNIYVSGEFPGSFIILKEGSVLKNIGSQSSISIDKY